MSKIFLTTLNQTTVLLFIMSLGYILGKLKLLDQNAGTVLSRLESFIFLPAVVFQSFSRNFTVKVFTEQKGILISGFIILIAGLIISIFLAKLFTKDKDLNKIYIYAFTISNNGYMGLTLVGSVFGDDALFKMILFCIPANIFIYTVGIMLLTPQSGKISFKSLLNPSIIAMVAGAVIGIIGIQLPLIVDEAATSLSKCMAPVAMLLTGFIIAKNNILELLKAKKAYFASLIRLVVLPIVGGVILKLIGVPEDLMIVSLAFLSMPIGLNTVVFPAAYGGNSTVGAQMAFISHTLSIITIPIIFAIFLP